MPGRRSSGGIPAGAVQYTRAAQARKRAKEAQELRAASVKRAADAREAARQRARTKPAAKPVARKPTPPKPKPKSKSLSDKQVLKKLQRESGGISKAGPGLLENTEEVGKAIIGIPGGLFGLGKAVALDVAKPKHGPFDIRHSRTAPLLKEMGKAFYRDVRHPLRNPMLTALDLSAFAGAGAGTAARASAATRAGRAAGLKAAGKAAIKKPVPGPRTHIYEDQPVRGRYSDNPAAAAVQRANDRRALKRAHDVSAATGKKVSTIGVKKAERLLSEERRVIDAAQKAPALRAQSYVTHPGRRARIKARLGRYEAGTAEDMAIRVAAEGVPLDDVIAATRARAELVEVKRRNLTRGGVKGSKTRSPQLALRLQGENKALLRKAALLEEARPFLTHEDGVPRVTGQIAAAEAATEKAALTREARLKKAGLLTLEAAERRKHAPGAATIKTVSGGRAVKITEPRTVEEAQARLDKIQPVIDKTIANMTKNIMGIHGPELKFAAEGTKGVKAKHRVLPPGVNPVRFKGTGGKIDIHATSELMRPAEEFARDPGAMQMPVRAQTATELARKKFLDDVRAEAAKPEGHASAKSFVAIMDEADRLQNALQIEKERGTFLEGTTSAEEVGGSSLGTKTTFKGLDELEPYAGGRYRVPDVIKSGRKSHGPVAYRGGVPLKPGTLTHEYTGAARRAGTYTNQTIRAVAEDALDAERFLSVERFRQRLLPMGHKVRPSDHGRATYVPLRERKINRAESEQLRQVLRDVDIEKLTPDQAARVDEAVKRFSRDMFPDADEFSHVPSGQAVPGIVWVDKRLLGSQRKFIGRLPVIDTASDAVKGLILYGKPGYVTPNIIGNAALNVFQQGILAPLNWNRAVKLPRDLDFMMKEVMGSGYSHALAEGTLSPLTHVVQSAGNFWSHFVDDPFRKAAFIHQARRGVRDANGTLHTFKTDAEMRALLEDPRYSAMQAEITQRARDSIIDYERMGPVERDLIRRLLFIYPWMKGSTYYATQFLRDHPIQAAVFTKIGEQGHETALKELGPVPAWAEGSFKVGGSKDKPLVINPAAISPFGTPAEVMATAQGLLGGDVERSQEPFEYTNPVLQSAVEALSGRELFTGRELSGSYERRFAGQIAKGLPQMSLIKRLQAADDPATQEKTYPYTKGQAVGQFVVGSSFPRTANRQALNEQAPGASTGSKIDDITAERKAVIPQLRSKGWTPEDVKVARQAYTIATDMQKIRDDTSEATEEGEPYYRAVLEAEARYMHKRGVFDNEDLKWLVKLAKTGTYDEVRKRRNALVQGPYEDIYLTAKRNARKDVGYEEGQ